MFIAGDLTSRHVDGLEESLVELPAIRNVGLLVDGVAVARDAQGALDDIPILVELRTRTPDLFLRMGDLGVDSRLLALEDFQRQGVGVVSSKDLLALGAESR